MSRISCAASSVSAVLSAFKASLGVGPDPEMVPVAESFKLILAAQMLSLTRTTMRVRRGPEVSARLIQIGSVIPFNHELSDSWPGVGCGQKFVQCPDGMHGPSKRGHASLPDVLILAQFA